MAGANIKLTSASGVTQSFSNVEEVKFETTEGSVARYLWEGATSDATLERSDQMLNGIIAYGKDNERIVGSIPSKSDSDITVSGATVSVPSGYYSTSASKSVAQGTMGTVSAVKSISGNTATVTPSISAGTAGYNAMSAQTGASVTVTAAELVSGTTNITNTSQTDVTNSQYAQIVDANLKSENIAKDVTVLGITGTHQGGGSKPEETFTVTPTINSQTVTPTTGSVFSSGTVNPLFASVSTVAEMEALKVAANIGKLYKFTGTTGSGYTTNRFYLAYTTVPIASDNLPCGENIICNE